MKWLIVLLSLFLALVLLSYGAGLIGKGEYVGNFEFDEYDPEGNFITPTLIQDDLAVYIHGDGEPILVFPYPHAGTEEPMAQSDLSDSLLALGRRVITFDVPGAYASLREPQADMDEMLECGLQVLEAAGIEGRVDVAGHSMGGLIALGFALEHPERVDQLLLINTLSGYNASLKWGLPTSAWKWHQKEFWQLIYWGIRLQNGRGNLAMHKRLINLIEEASYVDKRYVKPLVIYENDERVATPVRFQWSQALWDINYAGELGRVAASTLITAGRYDPQTPLECAQELADGIPKNKLVIFESSGHAPFVEERGRFLDVVGSFLND
jgi:pimeloyl-ACP methyl ester carboxylesterase